MQSSSHDINSSANLGVSNQNLGTIRVPYAQDHGKDNDGNIIITYEFFETPSEIAASDNYDNTKNIFIIGGNHEK